MNPRDDLDRMLGAWYEEPYTAPTARILRSVVERTRQTRQRQDWVGLERWLPMAVITRPALALPLRTSWRLVLVALLALTVAVGGAVLGMRLLLATPAPTEGAQVLVYDQWVDGTGDIHTVRADGTDPRQLTSGPDEESAASWSPDGGRIAFRRASGGPRRSWSWTPTAGTR